MSRSLNKFLTLLVLLSPFSVALGESASAPKEVTLKVSDVGNNYLLSVPVSRLNMTIPKTDLEETRMSAGGSTASPRYFSFRSKDKSLIISGWFESSSDYSNFNKYWKNEKDSWLARKLPTPMSESLFKSSGWEGVAYDLAIPNRENTHIRAHWVEAGTWIDLHLSLTSEPKDSRSREKLMAFLNTIQVTVK